jgi:hypothetical protein
MNAAEERALFVARLQQAVRDAAVLTRSLQTARQLVGSSIESMELAVLTEVAEDTVDQLKERVLVVARELPSRGCGGCD